MIKHIYLIRGIKEMNHRQFGEEINLLAKEVAKNKSVKRLSYTATIEESPKISIIPFKKGQIASISVWTENSEPLRGLIELPGCEGVYSVTEALPVAYNKTWKDGEKTPGYGLLTLFKQKKNISYKTFLDRWHNSHTPMSLKYHPLWHYNRNVVEEKLTESSIQWDGIVEEFFQTRAELMNPFKFFGHPGVIVQRMINVYRDTNSFLDYRTIEPYLVTEYWVKS
jgi:hypothetical protein